MNFDFRYPSIEIDKEKSDVDLNISISDIKIDNDFLSISIDCYQFC